MSRIDLVFMSVCELMVRWCLVNCLHSYSDPFVIRDDRKWGVRLRRNPANPAPAPFRVCQSIQEPAHWGIAWLPRPGVVRQPRRATHERRSKSYKREAPEVFGPARRQYQSPWNLFHGGIALLLGWRETTIDVDLKFDPEPAGVFVAIPGLKRALHINAMKSPSSGG